MRLEHFMCHTHLEMEFGPRVNFITGQNGSGKSAILTALAVALGLKARGTERATSFKEFIQHDARHALTRPPGSAPLPSTLRGQGSGTYSKANTMKPAFAGWLRLFPLTEHRRRTSQGPDEQLSRGSYCKVAIDVCNTGDDAFRPEVYGNMITLERRITETSSTSKLKDQRGKPQASQKKDLEAFLSHYNLEVENPCTIMTQDKSRNFLHSGSAKDKFEFFLKATLLHHVREGLQSNKESLQILEQELKLDEGDLKPLTDKLQRLEALVAGAEKIREMELQRLAYEKLLAWAIPHAMDIQASDIEREIEITRSRMPKVLDLIAQHQAKVQQAEAEQQALAAKCAMAQKDCQLLRGTQEEINTLLHEATKEKEVASISVNIQRRGIIQLEQEVKRLEHTIKNLREQAAQATQTAQAQRDAQAHDKVQAVADARQTISSLEATFSGLKVELQTLDEAEQQERAKVADLRRKISEVQAWQRRIQAQQKNKVTAFGGQKVIQLLRQIELMQHSFTGPPIGPLGVHLTLVGESDYSLAVEVAIGKQLDSFVVTNLEDSHTLRHLAKEINFHHLSILIYDFGRPRIQPPEHMMPRGSLLTVMGVLHTDSSVVHNVLIDQAHIERVVLVDNFQTGKHVAFDRGQANVKECITLEGLRMYVREGQEVSRKDPHTQGSGRLSRNMDNELESAERELADLNQQLAADNKSMQEALQARRLLEDNLKALETDLRKAKVTWRTADIELRETQQEDALNKQEGSADNVGELEEDLQKLKQQIHDQSKNLEGLEQRLAMASSKWEEAQKRHSSHQGKLKEALGVLDIADREMSDVGAKLTEAKRHVLHYEAFLQNDMEEAINKRNKELEEIRQRRQSAAAEASAKCSEEEASALGPCNLTMEGLRAKVTLLQERIDRDSRRQNTSNEELVREYQDVADQVSERVRTLEVGHERYKRLRSLMAIRAKGLILMAKHLKSQASWLFNSHLLRKGFRGKLDIDYDKNALELKVVMPSDSSGTAVKDTRALSGGERSFSTLAFVLTLHGMSESPIRAMEEFDIYMDDVTRKICLETLVKFATYEGSQWIFITPHDISMVEPGPLLKKQQMRAPR
eukprot:SM000031S11620  [mRNA]  locus=s31:685018:693475:- [translate_table: standard]